MENVNIPEGSEIINSVSFLSFCKDHGKPALTTNTNAEGEKFKSLVFGVDSPLYVHFSSKFAEEDKTVQHIVEHRKNLYVGQKANGKYCLYELNNREEIDFEF